MRVFNTTDPAPSSESERLWVYNAHDSAVTLEVLDAMLPQLDPLTQATYDLELALQGPVLDMQFTGILVDKYRRAELRDRLKQRAELLLAQFNEIVTEGLGCPPINPNSPAQLASLLYGVLRLPPIRSRATGALVCDEKALVKLRRHYYATLLCNYVLELRDVQGKIKTLNAKPDPDGRMRFSISIAGTTTGRFASYTNAFGRGTNGQNITEELRALFVADAGMKLAYIDLERAESYAVGAIIWNLFNDGVYLDACESSDLHIRVCRTAWALGWSGDDATDRAIADAKCYRDFSYRDVAKRLGHASNYLGTPKTIAEETGIALQVVKEFQPRYFAAFPRIGDWQQSVAARLLNSGHLISLMQRKRWFHDRLWEDSTIREAVAYDPQSSVADILNTGMLRLWRARLPTVQILLQVHDALLIEYAEEREHELLPQIMQLMTVPIALARNRTLTIPLEAQTGWNWSKFNDNAARGPLNLDGIKKYKGGHDSRKRTRTPGIAGLD